MEPAGKGDGEARLAKERRASWGDDVNQCAVCFTTFNLTFNRPRTLPCGHTFCTVCIDKLIEEQGHVPCPTCREKHPVPESGRFPICYIMENLLRKMQDAALSSPLARPQKDTTQSGSSTLTGPAGGQKGLGKKIQSLLQEQEAKVQAAIIACKEDQAQLASYQATLTGWVEQQQHLQDRLKDLLDQSNNVMALVEREKSQAGAKKEQVRQREEQLHALLNSLRKATTGEEAFRAINDADIGTDKERERAEEQLGDFPDVRTVSVFSKVREASSAAVEAAATVQAAHEIADSTPSGGARDSSLQAATASSITDRLEALLAPSLKVEDLRLLTLPARNLLQTGLVFAHHSLAGQSRYARISLQDGRQYLHCLQDLSLPAHAVIFQMEQVMPAAPPCLVFLDLAWPGSATRRVLVRLSPGTPLARQFVLLCTGQRGPSYAYTRLHEIWKKGRPGECVCGGDYEDEGGSGGAALLPDLGKGDYRESCRAGDVFTGWWCFGGVPSDRGAQFGIVTRDHKGGSVWPGVFGKVVEGLEGVAAAAQHSPIMEVTVVDCGVVLWW